MEWDKQDDLQFVGQSSLVELGLVLQERSFSLNRIQWRKLSLPVHFIPLHILPCLKLCPLSSQWLHFYHLGLSECIHFKGKQCATLKGSNSAILIFASFIIPAKFHDFSVMLTNLKDSHDLTIVF